MLTREKIEKIADEFVEWLNYNQVWKWHDSSSQNATASKLVKLLAGLVRRMLTREQAEELANDFCFYWIGDGTGSQEATSDLTRLLLRVANGEQEESDVR